MSPKMGGSGGARGIGKPIATGPKVVPGEVVKLPPKSPGSPKPGFPPKTRIIPGPVVPLPPKTPGTPKRKF